MRPLHKVLMTLALCVGAVMFTALLQAGPPSLTNTHTCTDTNTSCMPGNYNFQADVATSNTLYAPSLVVTTTTAARGGLYLNQSSVALTSTSAVTNLNAGGKFYINLSANINLPDVYPTNGAAGQILLIRAALGQGTNTMVFKDNASTMSLGADRTLTEGNNSTLQLICTVGGARPSWAALNFSAN